MARDAHVCKVWKISLCVDAYLDSSFFMVIDAFTKVQMFEKFADVATVLKTPE